MSTHDPSQTIGVHLTNLTGIGAVRLAESLLPAMLGSRIARVRTLYLPEHGSLRDLGDSWPGVDRIRIRRRLPNAASRLVECVLPNRDIRTDEPLLVLGDLPLRSRCQQTLFVQTPHLVSSASVSRWTDRLRFAVARAVLRSNLSRVGAVIVQTPVMREALSSAYPTLAAHIHVVGQPPPQWLASACGSRSHPVHDVAEGLRLAYPAAGYPHKNHALLGGIVADDARQWPVQSLSLTLADTQNPASRIAWVGAIGQLDPAGMVELYSKIDALVFLSLEESYGFPLIEAMCVGLPIVCADRAYARALCGEMAIYFDPRSVDSLRRALVELHSRLRAGWWPDWSERVTQLPTDWQSVADQFLAITIGSEPTPTVPSKTDP